ncbi:MAG TPA: M20/M25/M40 family metallo-hydrolase [Bryobacteraceae bacterium]
MRNGALILTLAVLLCRAGDDAQQRIAGRAFGPTPLLSDLAELCDRIGGRPTGSPAMDRAIAWAAAKFKDAGADSVTLEPFTVPQSWTPQAAEAECLAPEKFPLRIVGAPYSGSTNGALEARLLDADDGAPNVISALGEPARGAVLLVSSREMKTLDDLFAEYMRSGALLEAARKAGAAALLLQSTRPHGLLYRHPIVIANQPIALPTAVISREQAGRLARLAAAHDVRIRLRLTNRTGGPFESRNVVAEIRGRELPNEVVLLGAHLDSWDLGTGAEDNGANAVMVIDAARAIKQLGLKPRRSIRFVLFGGEEQGLWGSAGYVKRHAAEMDRYNAAIVFDMGSGRTTGFFLNGREDLRRPLDQALAGIAGFESGENPSDGIDGTDNFDFLLAGVPNLVANQDASPYLPPYHAESDTFDRINARELRANAAVATALVWSLAENPERFGRRLSRAEVQKLLTETKLDQQMKAFGQWNDWEAGRRGR